MILWINGAFGSGKTQTAFELHRRIKNSFVFDPENTGFYIRSNIPEYCKQSDFQDFKMWRTFNNEILKFIDRPDMIIIVPMTVTDFSYWNELTKDLNVFSVILCASKETILKRLRKRFETKNSWAALQTDRCISAFESDFNENNIVKLNTDTKNIYDICNEIASIYDIELFPDNRSKIKRLFDTVYSQMRHLR